MASHDVVILGGGPAGCAAGTLLARHGHSVLLVRPSVPSASGLAESIPPSAERILDELGFWGPLLRAGFHRNMGNSVWWAGESPRHETFAEDRPGFHADRGGLEAVLTPVAVANGAEVWTGSVARVAEETVEGWRIRCDRESGGSIEVDATWVVDATGRHGLLARSEGRLPDRSTATLALVRRWRRPGGWSAEHAHRTLVESYSDGWAWSLPLDEEVRCFAAMIDGRPEEFGARGLDEMLEAELAKTHHLGPTREGATAEGAAWACPASLYTSARFGRPGLLLAGDAGSFIDPLSSFGVKKALSSGWLAGIVVHTALVDPAMTDAAVRFFDRREADVYRRYRRLSADFFEVAAAEYATPYWERRARAARAAGGGGSDEISDPDRGSAGVPEEEVRRAFDAIRARPSLDAVPGPSVRRIERAAVEGDRIVMQECLASASCPEGVRWIRGVDLGFLVATAPGHAEVPDAWSAYNAVAPPVTLPDYLTALATAFAAGLLEHRPD